MSFYRVFLVAFATLLTTGMTSAALAGCGGCGWGSPAPVAYAPPPAPVYAPGNCGGGCGASLAPAYAPPLAVAPVQPLAPAPIAVDHWDTGGYRGCGGGFGGCGGFGSCGLLSGLFGGCGSGFGGCGGFASCGGCGGCGAFSGCTGPSGCGGFGGCNHCGGSAYAPPVGPAPAPIYVVNQGPQYSGPGVMVPFGTYSPEAGLAAPADYPYISPPGYRYGYGAPYGVRPYGPAAPRFVYRERVFAHPHYYGPAQRWHRYPPRPVGVQG